MQSTHLDLGAAGGYSSNPGIGQSDASGNSGAAFVRLSANAAHDWSSERTKTHIMAFWEGSDYLGKGTRNLVSLEADTTHSLNERLVLSASADASADFSGQLSNRFLNPLQPEQPQPPVIIVGPPADNFLYGGREYRGDGHVGLVWTASELNKVSADIGVSREVFSGSTARDHTTEFASASYDRLLSERTTLGLQFTASRTSFDQADLRTIILNPEATFGTQLSPDWRLSASLGASLSDVRSQGVDFHLFDPSFSASICHESSRQHLCASASHYAESLGTAALAEASSFNLSWVDKLDSKQTVQVSAGYDHYGKTKLDFGTPQGSQYHAAASYDRHLNKRLSAGADVTASRFADLEGRRRSDFSGWVFVRYRIGDLL
jgi:hypothetical protein